MSGQTSPLEILAEAMAAAQKREWRRVQELCAGLGEHPAPVGAVARLNILICQYHLGYAELIPERALPLLSVLPVTGWLPCAGLALLAARKTGALPKLKSLVLALAHPKFEAWDLPSVPTYVMLQRDLAEWLMSEVVQTFLRDGSLTAEEHAKLQSLADRYLERAVKTAANRLERDEAARPQKPW